MRKRNLIGTGLATLVMLMGLVAPANAGPSQADAWEDCKWYLCLWDDENYEGRLVPNWKSGYLGPSYENAADSYRNTTGYWIGLYTSADYRGGLCYPVPPGDSHYDLKDISPCLHDSISSVRYAQYKEDACLFRP